jgi:hypothetical protein
MLWMSLGLGGSIGVGYALASYANARIAARCRTRARFMTVFLGGAALRAGVALALTVFVLLRTFVHLPAFLAALGTAFSIGLAAEVMKIHREAARRKRGAPRQR